jgi:hypothetical protein
MTAILEDDKLKHIEDTIRWQSKRERGSQELRGVELQAGVICLGTEYRVVGKIIR